MYSKILLLLFIFCVGRAGAEPVAMVANLQGWIDARIAEGQTQLKVPTGVYRLAPQEIAHLEFYGLRGIEIDFQDSEIVCTDRTRAIHLEDCKDIRITNLTIDYNPQLYAQGRLTEYTSEYFEIDVFDGYPIDDLSTSSVEVYDPETHELKPGFRTFHDLESIERLEDRSIRIHRKRHMEGVDDFVEVGDILLVKTKRERIDGKTFAAHGVYAYECQNLYFEEVTIYASNCFSFLGEASSNLHYFRCRVDRRSDDPNVGYTRMRSSNWDAFHSINAEVGPTIEECHAAYMGDDAVNIRGDYHIVAEADGKELTVVGKRDVNIQAGDPVEVLTRSGKLIAKAMAREVRPFSGYPKEKIDEAKGAFTLINPQICQDVWIVTLDRPIEIEDVSVICAVNRIGSGFKVINNFFGHNRSRGVLTKGSNGIISGNVIEDTGLESLKLSPNIGNWLEAAYYENLVVENNIVRNGKFAAHFGKRTPAQILVDGCRSGLVFRDNTIEYSRPTAMIVSGLDGGTVTNNTFKRIGDTETKEDPIDFENCSNIER
ncbi:right-handed parallel beta-helix repeat-containing protein [Pelagicoccus mobilis]|uniref:Right-handed parallel beta-helix repeat-containing protein n=1 Tax=Pelagicoccus mobilis TaxID=415221 RepID=A0A934RTI1_9BACT|nr:right-handed parallel beta-helix repeat-containing protein [Pelagicoccus mobilis]MBK1876101.1 right-handed parallel beta-helix repeat-containing protein [Pelagicoccus mobilis]